MNEYKEVNMKDKYDNSMKHVNIESQVISMPLPIWKKHISKKLRLKSALMAIILTMITACDNNPNTFTMGSIETSDTKKDTPIQSNEKALGMVELGAVKGASISVQTLEGYPLATATTDDKGFFTIDIDSLKKTISRYGANIKFVKVIATGGVDTDPNDDGVIVDSEKKPVKGTVTGIVKLDTIYKTKKFRINFISTAVVDILGSETNVSDEQISYIAKRIGVHDTNADGKIDVQDLTDYKMRKDESVAEVQLRDGYLEHIHNGDVKSQKLFIDDLKYETGFTRPIIKKMNGYYEVTLSKTDKNNTIYYATVIDSSKPSFEEYYGQQLNVNDNQALYYKECSKDYGCYKLQKVFFYADNYFLDYDYEPIEGNNKIIQNLTNLSKAELRYKKELKKLKELEAERDKMISDMKNKSKMDEL